MTRNTKTANSKGRFETIRAALVKAKEKNWRDNRSSRLFNEALDALEGLESEVMKCVFNEENAP